MALPDTTLTRAEEYLNNIATGDGTIPDVPLTRVEQYLAKIAGEDVTVPDVPYTRIEQYLDYIAENGGGSDITLETLNVSQNGTTNAPSGKAYNKVVANVPNSYAAADEGKVVEDGALVSQTAHAEVTQNGTIDTTLNNSVAVNVPTKQTLSWHQCPEAVRNYLAAAQAAYSDTNVTVIDQYAPSHGNEVIANTKPVGYTIDGVTFYDNEPEVATPFATTNKAGTLTALDWLRWVNTTYAAVASGETYPRGANCRDLGGWACDGGTIKYGMLFRGGEPNPVDRELMVDKIGIKTEVQLLPLSEQATDYKMKSAWGIDWAGNDTESSSVYAFSDSKALWKKLLEPIMDSVIHAKPVFFHCGIGADRTGMIASALEGILGVSRADIDTEYELTNFAFGWQSLAGGIYRSRTYSAYKDGMVQQSNIPLLYGLANTFRNRWISFVLSCGIRVDKINAFRQACIDGTPDVITVIVPTYTISKSGSHVTYDNDTANVSENDPYSVGVTPASGYVISDVSVTMGGTDITSQVFTGTPTIRRVHVTNNLVNCSTSNSVNVVEAGTAYTATITAAEDYTLDGASVSIMMGGTNVSQYYSNGTINIPSVTGDVVISVTAAETVRENLFDPANARYNKRVSYSDGTERNLNGGLITNMIDITNIDTLTVEGITETSYEGGYALEFYYSTDTFGQGYIGYAGGHTSPTYVFDVASYKADHPTATHIALLFYISTAEISAADVADLAIYGS